MQASLMGCFLPTPFNIFNNGLQIIPVKADAGIVTVLGALCRDLNRVRIERIAQ